MNVMKSWPDAAQGLTMMKEDFMSMPLSNGDYRSMLDIAKYNGLPWDGIISAEFFDKVKPDPGVYYGARKYWDHCILTHFPSLEAVTTLYNSKPWHSKKAVRQASLDNSITLATYGIPLPS